MEYFGREIEGWWLERVVGGEGKEDFEFTALESAVGT